MPNEARLFANDWVMFWHGLRICRLVFAQLLISVFYQLDSEFKFPKAGPCAAPLPVLDPDKEIDSFSFCCNWQFENMKMDSQNLITALLDAISNFPVTYGYVVEIYIYSCTRWLWLLCWVDPPQLCRAWCHRWLEGQHQQSLSDCPLANMS